MMQNKSDFIRTTCLKLDCSPTDCSQDFVCPVLPCDIYSGSEIPITITNENTTTNHKTQLQIGKQNNKQDNKTAKRKTQQKEKHSDINLNRS